MTPFYCNEKLAFHVGLILSKAGTWNIITNIPQQILLANKERINGLYMEQKELIITKSEYVKKISEIIFSDERSKLFFYSNFIDSPEYEIRKSFREISHCRSNLIMIPNLVYSKIFEPARFYILCTLYLSTKTFQADFFNKNVPSINRKTFENAIPNIESQRLYVDFYDKTNEFKLIDDGEFRVYFLLSKDIPKMIFVKHL